VSDTTDPSGPEPRQQWVVVAGTWAVALLLLGGIAVLRLATPADLPDEPAPVWWAVAAGVAVVTAQAAVLAAALVRRRTSPLVALLAVCAGAPLGAALGLGSAVGATTVAVFVAVFVAVTDGLLTGSWSRVAPALVGAAALVALGDGVRAARSEGLGAATAATAVLQGVVVVAVAAVVGAVVGARRETARARLDRLRALSGEQAALTEAAVSRQRTAMARELHDIAAHHLSGIAVVTAALDRQIDTDPEGAKVAVRQVRQQSTAMLRDLRSLVALLREDGSALAEVEPETLAGLPRLVAEARGGGRDVDLTVHGADDSRLADLDIGPLAQLAAYRTVQEALANAARHAPGAAVAVTLDARDPARVVVAVRNDPPPAPATTHSARRGFGIIGMRERAELTDARLRTGPTADGGFEVVLDLPRDVPPSEESP
jgi:signal transduction histidine kinase